MVLHSEEWWISGNHKWQIMASWKMSARSGGLYGRIINESCAKQLGICIKRLAGKTPNSMGSSPVLRWLRLWVPGQHHGFLTWSLWGTVADREKSGTLCCASQLLKPCRTSQPEQEDDVKFKQCFLFCVLISRYREILSTYLHICEHGMIIGLFIWSIDGGWLKINKPQIQRHHVYIHVHLCINECMCT